MPSLKWPQQWPHLPGKERLITFTHIPPYKLHLTSINHMLCKFTKKISTPHSWYSCIKSSRIALIACHTFHSIYLDHTAHFLMLHPSLILYSSITFIDTLPHIIIIRVLAFNYSHNMHLYGKLSLHYNLLNITFCTLFVDNGTT